MTPFPLVLPARDLSLELGPVPRIMGIVNVTDDSFSDGGRHPTTETALAHARRLVAEGADILDIGGQSTRPGYVEVDNAAEIARTAPLIRALAAEFPALPLSIDTYQPAVASAAFAAGVHILNDVHGLQGPGGAELARLAAEHRAAVVVMHHDPALRDLPLAADPMPAVLGWLRRSVGIALAAGVSAKRIVLDPGIGFGKTQPQNHALFLRLGELRALGFPLLLGISRKSLIRHLVPELESPADRDEATLALTALGVRAGVEIHRVHAVRANRRAALLAAALG